ncbi:MAG: dihydropteroate synthase [Proteocatella sp.]
MKIGKLEFDFNKNGYIMGILNVTPDSFSDGGKFANIELAVKQAQMMAEEGASIIDIGGESTRPGHKDVTVEEEIGRVVPVIKELSRILEIPISIDTSKASVAEAAIEAGASMINDVWGFKRDPEIARVAAKYDVPVCLMHNTEVKGYDDLIKDMTVDLLESIEIAVKAGVKKDKIILDPGIGFAKTLSDNLKVMQSLEVFSDLGYPVLLGTSRKSMVGLALQLPVDERLEGTLATTVLGYVRGCRIFRVHDVKENYRALKMMELML